MFNVTPERFLEKLEATAYGALIIDLTMWQVTIWDTRSSWGEVIQETTIISLDTLQPTHDVNEFLRSLRNTAALKGSSGSFKVFTRR